ncbi:MAG: hypothetical protein KJ072_12460 [Verrucomicrobia bacterium]|nr:hypothetical protein [Verrucomicrobiota bacterium]
MTGDSSETGKNLGWRSHRHWIFAFAALLTTSTTVLANAGTPLMWAGMLHLVFGNFLIGVGEGLVLAWVFRLRKIAAMALMIAANYASAWFGLSWLQSQFTQSLDLELYNAWRWVWIIVGVSYLITLVLEWPFVALCFLKERAWLRRSLVGCLLVQTISYVFLFGWYWGASGKSLYTQGVIVPLSEFALPNGVAVYYIGEDDGNVHEFDFGTRHTQQVFHLGSTNTEDRLVVLPSQLDGGPYGVSARLETDNSDEPTLREVLGGLREEQIAFDEEWDRKTEGTWFNFGRVLPVGGMTNSIWEAYTGYWPVEGVTVENNQSKADFHLAFETPFAAWYIRNAAQLPSGQVVFQLGEDQVCILEPESRKVARLAFGRGPVVVLLRPSDVAPPSTDGMSNTSAVSASSN